MMKQKYNKFIAIFFPFITVLAYSQPNSSSYLIVKNDTNFLYTSTFNVANQKTLEIKQVKNNNVWTNLQQSEWLYDNGLCYQYIEKKWNGVAWQNNARTDYAYTFYGDVDLQQEYAFVNNEWVLQHKIDNLYQTSRFMGQKIYDASNALVSENQCYYSTVGQIDSVKHAYYSSAKNYRYYYSYNANNQLDTLLVKLNDNGVWRGDILLAYFYYANGSLALEKTALWNVKSTKWENSSEILYEYDSQNRIENIIFLTWQQQYWQKNYAYSYIYDTNNSIKNQQFKQSIYQEWRNLQHITYNAESAIIESQSDFWGVGANRGNLLDWTIPFVFNGEKQSKLASRIVLNYNADTGTNNDTNGSRLVVLLPNPSDGLFYIESSVLEVLSCSVYDLNGRKLFEKQQFIDSNLIDLTSFISGIYIVKIETKDGVFYQKVIKK